MHSYHPCDGVPPVPFPHHVRTFKSSSIWGFGSRSPLLPFGGLCLLADSCFKTSILSVTLSCINTDQFAFVRKHMHHPTFSFGQGFLHPDQSTRTSFITSIRWNSRSGSCDCYILTCILSSSADECFVSRVYCLLAPISVTCLNRYSRLIFYKKILISHSDISYSFYPGFIILSCSC